MKSSVTKTVCAALALFAGTTGYVAAAGEPLEPPQRPTPFKPPQLEDAPIPQDESTLSVPNAGFATPMAFNALRATVAPASQTLSGPVTLSYSGTANAFSVTQGGTGRGVSASVTNAKDGMSSVYGDTTGSGAGVMGSNLGTLGPGGKFQVTNANSAQAGAFGTTSGTGPGILGTITNKTSQYPAVFGQSTTSANGIGVEGKGNYYGVYGLVPSSAKNTFTAGVLGETDVMGGKNPNYAVYGYSANGDGIGVGATADSGYGIYAYSNSNYALYAYSATNSAIYAQSDSTSERAAAVLGVTQYSVGVEGSAHGAGTGVYGFASNGNGVLGEDAGKGNGVWGLSNKGIGVYGSSMSGLAAFFEGSATVTETLTVGILAYSSDKNLKTAVREIDAKDLLERVSELPITSWQYKRDPHKRHVGPMAQDFHAAFGLNGDDETHISDVDIAGVSLAAIKALNSEMKAENAAKTAQIAAQAAKITELSATVATQAQTVAEMKQQFVDLSAALEKLLADRVAANR
jgi:uncharacterized coiled-coil protein SlyX